MLRQRVGVVMVMFGLCFAALASCGPADQPSAASPAATATPTESFSPVSTPEKSSLPAPPRVSVAKSKKTPDARPSSRPSKKSSPKPVKVAGAIPTKLSIPGLLAAPVDPGDTVNGEFKPPLVTKAYWWQRAGKPGTDATDTVYLYGHTVRAGGGVFDKLQDIKVTQLIYVTTSNGTLRYEVTKTHTYTKEDFEHAKAVYQAVPGQLVIFTCFLNSDGSRQDHNFVVFAKLTGAAKK